MSKAIEILQRARAGHGLGVMRTACTAAAFAATFANAASVSVNALKACAAIQGPSERLACYDQLAGRASAPTASPAPLAAGPAPLAAGPAPLAASPAPVAASPAPVAPSASPVAASPAPRAQESKEMFGLHSAEHSTAPVPIPQIQAVVIGFGRSAHGILVMLEGGQTWQMDESDPLLKGGDTVIIKRAALGSFLLTTPGGRTHYVHRLK